jgi:uncharacterized protein with GYD domain
MPQYVMLSRLTDHGAKTIRENPNRILEVDEELRAMGVEVISQFAVLGEYDFVSIVEAPDNLAIAKASVELGARGSVRIETMPAIPVDELIGSIR